MYIGFETPKFSHSMNGVWLIPQWRNGEYYSISLLLKIHFYLYINNKYLTQIDATDANISENLGKIEENVNDTRYVDYVFAI